MSKLLEVKNLSVSFFTPQGEVQAVQNVSFSLEPGETLAIVGESGCGKSVLCKSIMKLLPQTAKIKSGSILLNGTDIAPYRERDMHKLRGKMFSMVFQDPMTTLNPTMSIGAQIAEAIKVHSPGISKTETSRRVMELMELVGIDHPQERKNLYPYNFSGGMRQRSVMAIALAGNPRILFADEPTTALDVTIQAQILDLLQEVQKRLGTATIFVTHDLGVVARTASRVAVMYAGKIVETGTAEEIYYTPRHPYTWGLLRALPALSRGRDTLYAIPGMPPTLIHPPKGDAFAGRNPYALDIDYQEAPPMFRISDTHYAATWLLDARAPKIKAPIGDGRVWENNGTLENNESLESNGALESNGVLESNDKKDALEAKKKRAGQRCGGHKGFGEVLLNVQHLSHIFQISKRHTIKALDDVSFQIYKGEIFGLVGESGSGKSTAARCIMNLYRPFAGKILYKGIDTCNSNVFRKNKRVLQTKRQMIFQDSNSSLNQRMKVCDIIAEPLKIQGITPSRGSLRAEAEFQMRYVGLDSSYLDKYPSEMSGGQRQRAAIARALAMEPELLVADEPIASLDVSIQAQIVNLFKHLQQEHGFSFLFIAHDLAMVEFLCDRVGVMYRGRLVESAPTKELFANPLHPYTKALLSAIPSPDPKKERSKMPLAFHEGEFFQKGRLMEATPQHFVLQEGRQA